MSRNFSMLGHEISDLKKHLAGLDKKDAID